MVGEGLVTATYSMSGVANDSSRPGSFSDTYIMVKGLSAPAGTVTLQVVTPAGNTTVWVTNPLGSVLLGNLTVIVAPAVPAVPVIVVALLKNGSTVGSLLALSAGTVVISGAPPAEVVCVTVTAVGHVT